jgi:acetolactate synthase-1/2/3 large subunit
VYPQGEAAAGDTYQARLGGQTRRFEQVAQAFGAHGEEVCDPAKLDEAIARCLLAVDNGQAAVLNVRIGQM